MVLVAAQKGGVGKTSLTAGLGALMASTRRRVLLIDADQQANLSRRNFGLHDSDGGRGLYASVVLGQPLLPVREVRPGLDIVAGGAALALVPTAAAADSAQLDLVGHLRAALSALTASTAYSLVLIDVGPGDVALLDALLGTVRFVLAPTREDDADLDGVEKLIARMLRARKDRNPDLELLGVVRFGVDLRATVRNSATEQALRQLLHGSGVEPFTACIRHAPAAARDMRAHSLTPQELVARSQDAASQRIDRLRSHAPRLPADQQVYARSTQASSLASDYLHVLKELLQRIGTAQKAAA